MSDTRVSGKRASSSVAGRSHPATSAAVRPATGTTESATTTKTSTTHTLNDSLKSSVQQSPATSTTSATEILKTISNTEQLNIAANDDYDTNQDAGNNDDDNANTNLPLMVNFLANFHQICIFTAILPLVTLLTCFVTAYVFQYDDVHETHCRVYNIIPSISAITGVSPQRYFWRYSIAVHLGPRIPIAFLYKNFYLQKLQKLKRTKSVQVVSNTTKLIYLAFVLNCVEIAALGGVTYVSNRENYPIHERIFIVFMICSLVYMLITIKLNNTLLEDHTVLTRQQRDSIKWKRILFAMSILSTIGLLIFFAKHRFYCHDLAFSWFAFFEYLIAIANMLFHFTIIWDFSTLHMVIVQGTHAQVQQLFRKPVEKLE